MKILYLAEFNPLRGRGIYKKIVGQCDAWVAMGHDVKLIILTPTPSQELDIVPSYLDQVGIGFLGKFKFTFFTSYLNKLLASVRVLQNVKRFDPDVTYYRFSIWYPGLIRILNSSSKVVLEVNTDDKKELEFSSFLKRKIYFYGKDKIFRAADGIISVTREILSKYLEYSLPGMVVANGYNSFADVRKLESENPNLVFVSSNLPWHGIDKVLNMAEKIPDFEFHIVGPGMLEENFPSASNLSNVHFYGLMRAEELTQLYTKMDVGIGSLSLYKYGLNEACPLKTREYLSNGLPVIIGYNDTDLTEKDNFVLYLGNDEQNVSDNINPIAQFSRYWLSNRINMNEIQSRISYSEKEIKRLNFFSEICGHAPQ